MWEWKILLQGSDFISFGFIPRSGIVGPCGSSIFNFLGTAILFSIMAIAIYIPTSSTEGFPFLFIGILVTF